MKKKYNTPRVLKDIGLQLEMGFLAGSIIEFNEGVSTEGQEIGGYYDSTDSESMFNHEWEE